ncbi:uncharacterized protein LOC143554058 [Bidens hawaiensis]|uniref:uncharacterized protein LOC143554058 n=1 Tax=Bidens hawaiensis TaxID=980011 RepID=UPI00404AA9F0
MLDVDNNDEGTDDASEDSDFIVDEDNILVDFEVDMEEFRAIVDVDVGDEDLDNDSLDDDSDFELDLDDYDSLTDEDNDPPIKKALKRFRKKKKKIAKDPVAEPFYVCQKFPHKEEIKALVKTYTIQIRRQLCIAQNDKSRFRVECFGINQVSQKVSGGPKGKRIQSKGHSVSSQKTTRSKTLMSKPKKRNEMQTCPWVLHVSNHNLESSWVVKIYKNEHTCLQTREVRLCTMSFLAREFVPKVAVDPNITTKTLQDEVEKKYQI